MDTILDFLKNKKNWQFVFLGIAIVISGFFIIRFLGADHLNRILLSPSTLAKPSFSIVNNATGVSTIYRFNEMHFIDAKNDAVSLSDYKKIFDQIKNLTPIRRFHRDFQPKAKLEIYLIDVRLDQRERYQTMEFEDDVFRVELKKLFFFPYSSQSWLYYRKVGILNFVQKTVGTNEKNNNSW